MTPPGAPLLCWQCQCWAAVPGANLTPSKASALICHCSMITAGRSSLLPACCHPCSRHIPAPRDVPSPETSQLQTHPSSRDIPASGNIPAPETPQLPGPSQHLRHASCRDIPAPDCQERTSVPGRSMWDGGRREHTWPGMGELMPCQGEIPGMGTPQSSGGISAPSGQRSRGSNTEPAGGASLL